MSHEQFTRGDLAFNRGVTLFCRRDMSPEFKLIWIQGKCRGDKISSPQQVFSWKSSVHTMGFVAGTKSPRHVPATCPLVWADLSCAIGRLSTNFFHVAISTLMHSRVGIQSPLICWIFSSEELLQMKDILRRSSVVDCIGYLRSTPNGIGHEFTEFRCSSECSHDT